MVALFVILSLAISFLVTAGLTWVLCWALPAIGVVAIDSFTIVFSWKLAFVVWIILLLLQSIFKVGNKNG